MMIGHWLLLSRGYSIARETDVSRIIRNKVFSAVIEV